LGGPLQVSFTATGNQTAIGNQPSSAQPLYTNIWLSGPATLVFKGEL